MSPLDEFNALVIDRLVPEFCSDPSRCMQVLGFVPASNRTTEIDAADFLRAWNAGLCVHQGRGQYLVGQARVHEQFFWSGTKQAENRSFTLWMEPIITVAAIGRLHLDFLWPVASVGSQSKDWAFDIVAKKSDSSLCIVGEVKKSRVEVDDLIGLMVSFAGDPSAQLPGPGKMRNAFKKVASLRAYPADLLWIVGPDRYEFVFEVRQSEGGAIGFAPVSLDALRYVG